MKQPMATLFALPGARLAQRLGLAALASRLYVYLSGFLAVFLLAAQVAPARFGEYSIYQSVLEVALVVGTLGSALLFSRNAASVPPRVTQGDLARTLAIGLPLAAVLAAAIVAAQRLQVVGMPLLLVLATLAVFAFNSLRMSYSRGLGHAGLLNLESGLRSTLLVLGVAALAWLGLEIGVTQLLVINLLGFVLVGAAIALPAGGAAPPHGKPVLELGSQATATAYALLTFVLRKSDLLIVALFMPLSYVGAFKLAFLLAEAPSQFVQAFLITKTPAMLDTTAGNFTTAKLRLARHAFFLGCALFAALAALLTVAAPLLKVGDQAREIFVCMAPYFLLRTYTVHHEMLLSLNATMGSLGRWALLEVVLRMAGYGLVLLAFPDRPHYVFFVAFFSDFLLYELRMRALFGFFPLVRLLRPAP